MDKEELVKALKELVSIEEENEWDGSRHVVLKIDGETTGKVEIFAATYDDNI